MDIKRNFQFLSLLPVTDALLVSTHLNK